MAHETPQPTAYMIAVASKKLAANNADNEAIEAETLRIKAFLGSIKSIVAVHFPIEIHDFISVESCRNSDDETPSSVDEVIDADVCIELPCAIPIYVGIDFLGAKPLPPKKYVVAREDVPMTRRYDSIDDAIVEAMDGYEAKIRKQADEARQEQEAERVEGLPPLERARHELDNGNYLVGIGFALLAIAESGKTLHP